MDTLHFRKSIHINQIVDDYDKAIAHYQTVLGAHLEVDFREAIGPYNNCLLDLGNARLELFHSSSPENTFARQNRRYGNFWHAIQFDVESITDTVAAANAMGVRTVDVAAESHWAFLDPRDTYGLTIQVGDGEWRAIETTNDAGILELAGVSVITHDAAAAADFFVRLVDGAAVLGRSERPNLGAYGISVRISDYTVEFQSPSGPGIAQDYINHFKSRIRTATFQVSNLDQLTEYVARSGIELVEGDRPGTKAISSQDNLGIPIQFSE